MKSVALNAAAIRRLIPKRPAASHKGRNGHLFVLAGSRGMSGAPVLVGLGGLRIGAGLVTIATIESERSGISRSLPEALTLGLPETGDGQIAETAAETILPYLKKRRVNALALGPGLGVGASVKQVLKQLLAEVESSIILDADALNNLSLSEIARRPGVVITPHPGEMARLLDGAVSDDPSARIVAAEDVAKRIQGTCLLKGHATVISDGSRACRNSTGNAAMATGGMGDVLTGVIGGLLAQGLTAWDAACAGAYLHGLAGDLAKIADRGLLATELADALPKALAKLGLK
jgi:hydroxyethylthiazole kinase-like uncharacterized protein yjeF